MIMRRATLANYSSGPIATGTYSPLRILRSCVHTLFLFTYTDYKTILFPITVFGCVLGPVYSFRRILHGVLWIWLHLLHCNVSNQYKTIHEDAVIRPWRPLPSGRITPSQAIVLRWLLIPLCTCVSSLYNTGVVIASAGLTMTTLMYDEVGFSGHWLGKNAAAIFGYVTFEIGATKIIGNSPDLDGTAVKAICYSVAIIFTTIHAQDFADVKGDKALGRVTFPIHSPKVSRWSMPLTMIVWSIALSSAWEVGPFNGLLFSGFGAFIGWRYLCLCKIEDDQISYLFYNIWLLLAHLLPANARWQWLKF